MSIWFAVLLVSQSCMAPTQTTTHLLSPQQVSEKKATQSNLILVDVRTPDEYAQGHIDGARLINYYDADWSQQMNQLPKNQPIVVYCAVGGRSGKAFATLQKLGFIEIYDMKGGFDAWRAQNLPIAR
jgi:phage shock protein E